jgi:hypothetical protein
MSRVESVAFGAAWIVAGLIALPLLRLSVLGFLGKLADVGYVENALFGVQFLGLATIPLAIVATAWILLRNLRD